MVDNIGFIFEDIYDQYITDENNKNREKYKHLEPHFGASSAGLCFNKQYYKINKYKEEADSIDYKSNRRMRLGTIIHKDFENALIDYIKSSEQYHKSKMTIFKEYQIKIPELKVIGHLDYAIRLGDQLAVADFKSIAAWGYTRRFGRKENREKNPSRHYEYQVCTYAIALANELEIENPQVYLMFYKKDDSTFKHSKVSPHYMDLAWNYWEELNDTIETLGEDITTIEPYSMANIPAQTKWDCDYCRYQIQCKGDSNG